MARSESDVVRLRISLDIVKCVEFELSLGKGNEG